MDKVMCGDCGRTVEYLVDDGICEECLRDRLNNE